MQQERGRTGAGATDESSDRRGRSTSAHRNKHDQYVTSTGRGGAGNMMKSRSPPSTQPDPEAKQAHEHISIHPTEGHPVAVGRGGAGNFRSPSRDPKERAHLASENARLHTEEKEIERKHAQAEAQNPHPSGVGRGGAGNIVNGSHHGGHHDGASHEGQQHGGVQAVIDSVKRSFSKDRSSGRSAD